MGCCGLIASEQPIGAGVSPELQLSWGYSLTLGGRWYMEDYHTAEIKEISPGKQAGCFAIFDGHGGRQCVQFVQKRLYKAILAHPAFAAGDIKTAMFQGYMQIDEKFSSKRGRATCGTTSTTVLVCDNTLYVAHCGDSRAALVKTDAVVGLTRDHKPSDPEEAARIRARGGNIVDDDVPRVCGVLAVTRAFGNNTIKSTVNAEPEVSEHDITEDFEYVVIASDGVWDVLSNEDVAELIRKAENVRMAAEDITLEAYRLGSSDNISAVVIALNYTGPVPLTSSLANAVRNFSNRGVRPGRDAGNPGDSPGALTTTFDTGLRGSRGSGVGNNGARDAGKGGSTAGASGGGGQDSNDSSQQPPTSTIAAAGPAGSDLSNRTPPHSPLSDAVGYNVSPPARERRDDHSASQDAHAYPHQQHMHSHGYPYDSAGEQASQDTAVSHRGLHEQAFSPHQHPDGMQGGVMDQYEYEYEDDGVVFDGATPDSTAYAAANSPDAEARYWERIQNLPPDQGGFADQGDYEGGYGDYDGGGWGYGGYGSRWGHLEDIAEEGESAGLSGSQHMAGSSDSYAKHARSSSMEQRPPWGRGDRNGSWQRGVSPSPERRASSPCPERRASSPSRSISPKRQTSPPRHVSPPRHASPPSREPPANGAQINSAHAREYHDAMHALGNMNQRSSPQLPVHDIELPSTHPAAANSYDAGRSSSSAYHSADQGLDSDEYGAVQAHAQQYNSDIMGEHAYHEDGVDMHIDQHDSWDGSLDRNSNDGYSNYNSAASKQTRGRTSPVRAAKAQPVRHPNSGGAEHGEEKYSVGARDKHSVSGSSFMSPKSSASQTVSGKSSKSGGSPPEAPRVRRPKSLSGSPTRASSKKLPKRPPFKF